MNVVIAVQKPQLRYMCRRICQSKYNCEKRETLFINYTR